VFAFSATSTSWERSFSLARNKIGFRRHRLSPLILQRLMCSSYNRMVLERGYQRSTNHGCFWFR
jgi:hypothetical protein